MNVQFSGRYRLQVFHGDTDILLKDTGWFDNLITNNGLDLLGNGFSPACYVSSDTADPAVTDTSIVNILSSVSSPALTGQTLNRSVLPYYGASMYTFSFGIGAIQGTIGQVAVGASSTNLFSKARLAGVGGSPTTLTVGGIDRLSLTYELRQYIRDTDISHSIAINGVSYNCVNRAMRIDGGGWWCPILGGAIGTPYSDDTYAYKDGHVYLNGTAPYIGALTSSPSGTAIDSSQGARIAYVAGTYVRNVYHIWTTAKGTLTNITAASFGLFWNGPSGSGGRWQSSIEGPTLIKTQYQNLRLDFQYSWGRYP